MIHCENLKLERWLAPAQENMPRPTWTKLIVGERTLSNSIEEANWFSDPVEPNVCELCWDSGCDRTGLAHLVRLAEYLLWRPPRLEDLDESQDYLSEANFIHETILIPARLWESLRESVSSLPPVASYPLALRRDLASVWLDAMPENVRPPNLDGLESRVKTALASDPIDFDPALEVIREMVRWITQGYDRPVEGRFVRSSDYEGMLNTFYFDEPRFPEWPAFLAGRANSFYLGDGLIFLVG